jgi:hypothetical protein
MGLDVDREIDAVRPLGAAIKSGHIRSIDDPITQYAPQLAAAHTTR